MEHEIFPFIIGGGGVGDGGCVGQFGSRGVFRQWTTGHDTAQEAGLIKTGFPTRTYVQSMEINSQRRRNHQSEIAVRIGLLKGTVQRKLRGVKLYISRFVSLWAVVALLWFCQEYSCHFEIHEIQFSAI